MKPWYLSLISGFGRVGTRGKKFRLLTANGHIAVEVRYPGVVDTLTVDISFETSHVTKSCFVAYCTDHPLVLVGRSVDSLFFHWPSSWIVSV